MLAERSWDRREEDPEKARTQDLYGKMRSILNKLTPEVFPLLVKQINVPSKESPGVAINFRLVLLKLCQVEFQKLGEGTLANSVNGPRQRSIGNIRFIGELFKRAEPGPKTIRQVRRQAEMERQWERSLVQEFHSKTDNWRHRGKDLWVHEEPHPAWRRSCLLKEELREGVEAGARPEIFRHLMEEVNEFPINTEERLRGIAVLIFEKAISEEAFCLFHKSAIQNINFKNSGRRN
ncbi:hypothetical protein SKAU_G00097640 [Synaphobranchus kaupii]|uniref:Uncharacterized protein n=1 Tax=Synaphobranchus kaupii TaxID=118154 RepID=A0A9Q1J733_SYNKA|nr:hypothetical protein SKAU_G00097640 [Synaphobranchus kaupii]